MSTKTPHTARRSRIALAQHRRIRDGISHRSPDDFKERLFRAQHPEIYRHAYANELRANPLFVYDGVTYRLLEKALPTGDPLRAHPTPDAVLRKMMLADEPPHVSPMMLRADREGIR